MIIIILLLLDSLKELIDHILEVHNCIRDDDLPLQETDSSSSRAGRDTVLCKDEAEFTCC